MLLSIFYQSACINIGYKFCINASCNNAQQVPKFWVVFLWTLDWSTPMSNASPKEHNPELRHLLGIDTAVVFRNHKVSAKRKYRI